MRFQFYQVPAKGNYATSDNSVMFLTDSMNNERGWIPSRYWNWWKVGASSALWSLLWLFYRIMVQLVSGPMCGWNYH